MPETQTIPVQPVYEMTDADRKRIEEAIAAQKAYDGEFPKPLLVLPDKPDNNVIIPLVQAVVDTCRDFLLGGEVGISVSEGSPEEAQSFLDTIWGIKEERIPLLQKLKMNGAIARNGFLRIVPTGDSYRLVVVDSTTVFVQTDPQDCDLVTCYCIEYSQEKDDIGRDRTVTYREEIIRVDPQNDDPDSESVFADTDTQWMILHWIKSAYTIYDRPKWLLVGDPIVWPYPFPPLFSCQNLPRHNDFWGYADITTALIKINEAYNVANSNINQSISIYGNPILYSRGMGEGGNIDTSPGRIIQIGYEAEIKAVDITTDLTNSLAFVDRLQGAVEVLSSVPGIAMGRTADMPKGQISGIAIELLFMPLLKKIATQRNTYGKLFIDVSKALLRLAGFSPEIGVKLHWQNPLPHDILQALQASLLKKQIGVSVETLLRENNYDPEVEMQLSRDEKLQNVQDFMTGRAMTPPAQQEEEEEASPFIGRRS